MRGSSDDPAKKNPPPLAGIMQLIESFIFNLKGLLNLNNIESFTPVPVTLSIHLEAGAKTLMGDQSCDIRQEEIWPIEIENLILVRLRRPAMTGSFHLQLI